MRTADISIAPAIRTRVHQRARRAHDADEEAGEQGLEAERRERHAGDDEPHRARVVEVAEAVDAPAVHGRSEQHEAARQHAPRRDETALERDDAEEALHAPVRRQQAFGDRERLGEDGEDDGLVTEQDRQAGEQQRVRVEVDAADA